MHKVYSDVAGCKKGDSTGVTTEEYFRETLIHLVVSERDRERVSRTQHVFILICTHYV